MVTRSVQLLGTGQLIVLRRRLRAAGGARLEQNFTRRIRRAAEPLRSDLQQAIRSQAIVADPRRPGSRGGRSPTTRPLRATIAGAIRLSVMGGRTPGARVWIDRAALPADMVNMPSTINDGRIRHPTFGNKSRKGWVNSWARPPGWWDKTVRDGLPRMQAEVGRVVNDVRRDLG